MNARIFREVMPAVLFSMLAIGMATAETATAPSATVADQAVVDGRVTMARVFSAGPGWLVVHAQTTDGKTGPVIGWSPVHSGENLDVTVAIDAAKATPVLSAMLHVDAGVVGVHEFPGADAPARRRPDGEPAVQGRGELRTERARHLTESWTGGGCTGPRPPSV